ncbi:MAG: pyridoxamine 5'-phosphate oxidase family protein [Nitrospinae bacterium]|nr:pyridoxamine 5'-phosphate oxidase family protein [Nitrospinota bacterium]
MAKEWDHIADHLAAFARAQPLFFIATADPAGGDVNLSPKGLDALRVLGPHEAVYADFHGSGNQTAKHLAAGGKGTLLFVSFGEKPLILRFYVTGRVVAPGSDDFTRLMGGTFADLPHADRVRQLFLFDVYRVQTSCGYGAPMMTLVGDRREEKYFGELLGEE